MITFFNPTGSQMSSDASRIPTKTQSQNVQSKKSVNICWELTPLQEQYPLCCYRLLLHPSTVRFEKGGCMQGRFLLKGISLQIDNCRYRIGSSYYRNSRLATPITPAMRYLKHLTSKTHLTPQWKSKDLVYPIMWQKYSAASKVFAKKQNGGLF